MRKSFIEKPISLLVFVLIGVLIGTVGVTGLVGVEPSKLNVPISYGWEAKPVIVNVQVDLENEGDQFTVFNILNEIEKYGWHAPSWPFA
jgi:hypothetical protein